MAFKVATLVAFVGVLSAAVQGQITQNHESIVVTTGEEMDLICTAQSTPRACSFKDPNGNVKVIFDGAQYENGRITDLKNSERDCGIRVINVGEADNGAWECILTLPGEDGGFASVAGGIDVTVGVKPASLIMRNDDVEVSGDAITFKIGETEEAADIQCVAAQTRPKPTFQWFIGNEPVNGETSESTENEDASGKADYVQSLKYFPNAMHNEKELKCVVTHEAYTAADLEQKMNEVSKRFELYFKPMEKKKPQIFYGLGLDQPEEITITFEANPGPSEGSWMMAGMESPVAFGAADLENRFQSSQPRPTEGLNGEYSATLSITKVTADMAGKTNKLVVTNVEGTTEYEFELQIGDKPQPDSSSVAMTGEEVGSGTVIGVIVIVIIILIIVIVAIVARSKGILCFATKNGEQLQEEKDGAAFDNVEKGEPLNPKTANASGDKSPTEKKPEESATQAEEKKSNGAHTPV